MTEKNIYTVKTEATDWPKIFVRCVKHKGSEPRIYKELFKQEEKKKRQVNLKGKWAKLSKGKLKQPLSIRKDVQPHQQCKLKQQSILAVGLAKVKKFGNTEYE